MHSSKVIKFFIKIVIIIRILCQYNELKKGLQEGSVDKYKYFAQNKKNILTIKNIYHKVRFVVKTLGP